MDGKVITFYSYKGGVGRTFALASCATSLAMWGYRVLCIDFDLDAPGLSHYFRERNNPKSEGLLGLIEAFASGNDTASDSYHCQVKIPGCDDRLEFLPAGKADDNYVKRVHSLNWETLYAEHELGRFFESRRTEWTNNYHFVLIDSRTGISDIGGICTAHLPDILVLAFTANHQSLDGVLSVASKAAATRNRLPYDRDNLMAVPLLCRFDQRDEYKKAKQWRERIVDKVMPCFNNWAESPDQVPRLVDHLTIPYLSYWSFGEEIPVATEETTNPNNISYSLENLAALVANELRSVDLFVRNRDEFLSLAKSKGQRGTDFDHDVFVSFAASTDHDDVVSLTEALVDRGLRVFSSQTIRASDTFQSTIESALNESRHLVLVIGKHFGKAQRHEADLFMRQAWNESSDRRIVPVLMSDASPSTLPSFLQSIAYIVFQRERIDTVVEEIVRSLRHSNETRDTNKSSEFDEEDDEGLLDIADSLESKYELVIESMHRITEYTNTLGENIEAIGHRLASAKNLKDQKHITNEGAAELERYSKHMKTDLPVYDKRTRDAFSTTSRFVELLGDFEPNESATLEDWETMRDVLSSLRDSIREGKDGVSSFREALTAIPRLTTRLNRAKKEAVGITDDLLETMDFAEKHASDAVQRLGEILSRHATSNDTDESETD